MSEFENRLWHSCRAWIGPTMILLMMGLRPKATTLSVLCYRTSSDTRTPLCTRSLFEQAPSSAREMTKWMSYGPGLGLKFVRAGVMKILPPIEKSAVLFCSNR